MSKSNKALKTIETNEALAPVTGEVSMIPTVEDLVALGHKTTSAQIRYLFGTGLTRGQIAKHLNKRYQHVRNVLVTPIKKV